MAWTTPKTWSSEPLTSIDLNTYVRDNQNHLKDRLDASASRVVSGATLLTTTANDFVNVDATKLSLTLTTHGGDVLLGFTGTVRNSARTLARPTSMWRWTGRITSRMTAPSASGSLSDVDSSDGTNPFPLSC